MTPQALEILGRALADDDEHLDPYAERILDAAHDQFAMFGIRRATMDDIARRADVARATLYRRYPARHDLLAAYVLRETRRTIAVIDEATANLEHAADRVIEGFLAAVRHIRTHPIVARIQETDPDLVLPLMTTHAGPILALGRHYVAQQIRCAQAEGSADPADPDHVAELFVRIGQSLVLTPESVLPLDDPDALREIAQRTLVPLALGHTA